MNAGSGRVWSALADTCLTDLVRTADLFIRDARVWGKGPGDVAVVGDTIRDGAPPGPDTVVVDAGGRTLLPGFQDAHVHAPFGGLHLNRVWLNDAGAVDEYLDLIAAAPGTGWITGGGWSMTAFPGGTPRKETLDAVMPDRPVFLFNADLHGAWVNSRALDLAGITAATPDPLDGRVERDDDGSPTGTLHEGAAYWFNQHVVPAPTPQEWEAAILTGQAHLHARGITGWQDAWVTPATQRAYEVLGDALTARVVGALWWDRHRGLDQIEELLARRRLTGRFHATTVKIMLDGVLENRTGALLEPYCCHGDGRGLNFIDPDLLNEAVRALDAHGFQVHMHAIGDRAVRMGLDAIAAAGGAHRNRHHIAHLQVVHPDDIPRFGRLGVIANCQMLWACEDAQMRELTLPLLGEERGGWQYPFAALAAVTRLAAGSDWPVSTANPLEQIQVALTRAERGGRAAPLVADQALDRRTAFTAFTAGSAYVNHDERAGRIADGMRADLVLLGANLDEVTDEDLADVPVDLTVAAGRVVHAG